MEDELHELTSDSWKDPYFRSSLVDDLAPWIIVFRCSKQGQLRKAGGREAAWLLGASFRRPLHRIGPI